jgi:AraC-like DNA-binding protein
MLVVETIGRIRREHLQKGKLIKEIARDLKISRNTVRKILRSGETAASYEREVQHAQNWAPGERNSIGYSRRMWPRQRGSG